MTISMLLALAMQTFANTLVTVRTDLQGWSVWVVDILYWALLPHLELFDLTKREVHNFPAAPLWVLAALTIYAAMYSSIFMAAGMQRFRSMNL